MYELLHMSPVVSSVKEYMRSWNWHLSLSLCIKKWVFWHTIGSFFFFDNCNTIGSFSSRLGWKVRSFTRQRDSMPRKHELLLAGKCNTLQKHNYIGCSKPQSLYHILLLLLCFHLLVEDLESSWRLSFFWSQGRVDPVGALLVLGLVFIKLIY